MICSTAAPWMFSAPSSMATGTGSTSTAVHKYKGAADAAPFKFLFIGLFITFPLGGRWRVAPDEGYLRRPFISQKSVAKSRFLPASPQGEALAPYRLKTDAIFNASVFISRPSTPEASQRRCCKLCKAQQRTALGSHSFRFRIESIAAVEFRGSLLLWPVTVWRFFLQKQVVIKSKCSPPTI